jgi:hypothetical protein
MHKNELVNVLLAARSDLERHQERLGHLLAPGRRPNVEVDRQDAEEIRRLFANVLRELDEAITQRSLGTRR